jgi:hypothetical protein
MKDLGNTIYSFGCVVAASRPRRNTKGCQGLYAKARAASSKLMGLGSKNCTMAVIIGQSP